MKDHHPSPPWPVAAIEPKTAGARAIEAIQSRTNENTRLRIVERARTLRLDNFAVGVEIQPTHLVAVLTDQTGQNYGQRRHDLPDMEVSTVVRQIGSVVRELVWTSLGVDLTNRRVAVGLQIGGPVDARKGTVLSWRNPESEYVARPVQWTAVPLATLVEEETGCPTMVENDAAAYAAYELRFGAGFQTGSFAVILVRDGVGAGIVRDHQVLSIPFEVGHLMFRAGERECACGNKGCIEAYAGRRAIRGMIKEILGQATDADNLAAAIDIVERCGSERALAVFNLAGQAIAHGMATIITLFGTERMAIYCDPEMCDSNLHKPSVARFFAGVATYRKLTFPTFKQCQIEHKEWRSTDGALGAALVALNQKFLVPLAFAESVR